MHHIVDRQHARNAQLLAERVQKEKQIKAEKYLHLAAIAAYKNIRSTGGRKGCGNNRGRGGKRYERSPESDVCLICERGHWRSDCPRAVQPPPECGLSIHSDRVKKAHLNPVPTQAQ